MRISEGPARSAIGNERVKLLANTLNSAGLAFGIGGFVAPAISGQLAGWGAVIPIAGSALRRAYIFARRRRLEGSGRDECADLLVADLATIVAVLIGGGGLWLSRRL